MFSICRENVVVCGLGKHFIAFVTETVADIDMGVRRGACL
jgi:hypothetical protein